MIDRIITGYLGEHKRLVIPGFGAFIRKDEDGRVVFVEFLRKDDNVLLPILAAELGVGHAAAKDALDGYVSGVKQRIAQEGSYIIDGLGVMRRAESGAYDLAYDPQARAADVETEVHAPPEENPDETATTLLERDDRAVSDLSSPADSEEGTVVVFDESDVAKEAPTGHQTREETAPHPPPAPAPQDPPRRVDPAPEPPPRRPAPASGARPGRKKSSMDWIIIIAILAAVLAIIAMVFYLTLGTNPTLDIWNNAADSLRDSIPPPPQP